MWNHSLHCFHKCVNFYFIFHILIILLQKEVWLVADSRWPPCTNSRGQQKRLAPKNCCESFPSSKFDPFSDLTIRKHMRVNISLQQSFMCTTKITLVRFLLCSVAASVWLMLGQLWLNENLRFADLWNSFPQKLCVYRALSRLLSIIKAIYPERCDWFITCRVWTWLLRVLSSCCQAMKLSAETSRAATPQGVGGGQPSLHCARIIHNHGPTALITAHPAMEEEGTLWETCVAVGAG